MKMYQVVHRCGCKLTVIDDTYKGGNYPYCKKCHTNVPLPPLSNRSKEFKYVEVPVPVPIINNYLECQCQSQSVHAK